LQMDEVIWRAPLFENADAPIAQMFSIAIVH
jgi:hypothetical protein